MPNHRIQPPAIESLPPPLRDEWSSRWQQYQASAAGSADQLPTGAILRSLPAVWCGSPWAADLCLQSPALLAELIASGDLAKGYTAHQLQEKYAPLLATCPDQQGLQQKLREIRQREMLRIAWRDLANWAEPDETLLDLSNLADALIRGAIQPLSRWLADLHGAPIDAKHGQAMELVVLGMGKLGGRELNFSSDIDLVFAYPAAGQTSGPKPLSHQEFFLRLARQLIQALDENTSAGRVFRVDMRLRPFGNDGPLANHFDAFEHYYELHGRDWERYALIKARVIAGQQGQELLNRLRPFIYRRYLDYTVVAAIQDMKRLIEQEVARKGLADNIKLGAGGIREAEFFVQVHQLIQGGKHPQLQATGWKAALRLLLEEGIIGAADRDGLSRAYDFLRRVENRLQMLADRQTHVLPKEATDQCRLAFAMGFDTWPRFQQQLEAQRALVRRLFRTLLAEEAPGAEASSSRARELWNGKLTAAETTDWLGKTGFREPATALAILRSLRQGQHFNRASETAKNRLAMLIPSLLESCASQPQPDQVLPRLCNLIDVIINRSAYLVLLQQHPEALNLLVRLLGLSPWIGNWITLHPMLLDELLHPATLMNPPTGQDIRAQLDHRMNAIQDHDLEVEMNCLREVRHGNLLRIASATLVHTLSAERGREFLSDLAEQLLVESMAVATRRMTINHGRPETESATPPSLLVVAYGRLGSREMGFTSDLDLVFLHDNPSHSAMTDGVKPIPVETWFMRLAQRCVHVLTTTTTAGRLYQVDLRLRPGGNAGPPASHIEAFAKYLQGDAWTWEHQALVKARPILGEAALLARFEEIRGATLRLPRDDQQLQRDVVAMRERMFANKKPAPGQFHLKQSRGGLLDIEFIAQYLVLRHAHRHPDLTTPRATRDILRGARDLGLLERSCADCLLAAHAHLSALEQNLTLNNQEPITDDDKASETSDPVTGQLTGQVTRAWNDLLG